MIAARSITTILGWGGSAKAGVISAGVMEIARPAKASARRGFFILVSCGSAEVDDLGSVVSGFGIGQAQVDLDRAEGRFPGHADTGRTAEGQIVLHAGADAGILRPGTYAAGAQGVETAHSAEVGEQRKPDTITLRQQGGEAHLRRADRMHRAAQGPGIAGRDDVARADAGQGKAAERVAAVEEAVLERHKGAVITGDIAQAAGQAGDDGAVEHRRIGAEIRAGLDVFQIAAEAGESLGEGEGRAGGWLSNIVQVGIGVSEAEDG